MSSKWQLSYKFVLAITASEEITHLTGISNKMVISAPKFHEISDKVWDHLKGERFVSHKTDFDFVLLQKYFSELGKTLEGTCLCSLKHCQKLFEGLPSYSLDYLCDFLGVPKQGNHRALPDALMLQEIMSQILPALESRGNSSLHLPQYKKVLKKTPNLPGIVVMDYQNGQQNKFSCENLHSSYMVSCLQNKRKRSPSYVIYKFRDRRGLTNLKMGKFTSRRSALFYFWSKQDCEKKFEQITKQLRALGHHQLPSSDKTEIVKKNCILQTVLDNHIPKPQDLLFKGLQSPQGDLTYVHIKKHKEFSIFSSRTEIETKVQLPKITYKALAPWEYMQFLNAWQVIRNQRNKTDQILNF